MSAAELSRLIGRSGRAALSASGKNQVLHVDVTVLDARELYGRRDVLVSPVAGVGEAWVSLENVELLEPADSPEDDIEERRRRL
jgi:hypothetical protein